MASVEDIENLKAYRETAMQVTIYSSAEVALILGITTRDAQRKMKSGVIRASKINGKWFTNEESIKAYIDGRSREAVEVLGD